MRTVQRHSFLFAILCLTGVACASPSAKSVSVLTDTGQDDGSTNRAAHVAAAPASLAIHDGGEAEPAVPAPKDLCLSVQTLDFPPSDKPSLAQRALAGGSASRVFYYGIGVPVDYAKARYAAFVELERGEGLVFGDTAILAMLYANGYGVKRDLGLAIKLACTLGHAQAEIDGRVMHLYGLKSTPEPQPFDVCDDITSGFMMGHCAGLEEERKNVDRGRRLETLTASWPEGHRAAFAALERAALPYWTTRVDNEVDLSGTARGALMTEEEAQLKQDFLEALQRFERGEFPTHGEQAFRAADAELNCVYKKALTSELFSTVTADGIRATEKKWLAYRDAWTTFAALRYPTIGKNAFKTWLSLERARQLRALLP